MNLPLILAFLCWTLQAQTGLSPREVSPEIVRQMRREAITGISASDAEEHRKLRAADAELLKRIQAGERKRADLERYVDSLDITVDTRLLIEAKDDIKELKRAAAAAEEQAKRERESSREMISGVKTGVIMLLLGAGLKSILAFWKDKRDRKTRDDRHSDVLASLHEVKSEATAAFNEANNVNAKIASLGMKLREEPPDDERAG